MQKSSFHETWLNCFFDFFFLKSSFFIFYINITKFRVVPSVQNSIIVGLSSCMLLSIILIFTALKWLRQKSDVSDEIEEMRIEGERQRKSKKVRIIYVCMREMHLQVLFHYQV